MNILESNIHAFVRQNTPTCDLCTAADPVPAALIPQDGDLSLEHLQPTHEVFQHGRLVRAAAGLPRYVDAMGKDDLVVPIHGVLRTEMARGERRILGVELNAVRRVQGHWAQGTGRNVDAVDVIENHRVPHIGEGDVLFPGGGQSLPPMP